MKRQPDDSAIRLWLLFAKSRRFLAALPALVILLLISTSLGQSAVTVLFRHDIQVTMLMYVPYAYGMVVAAIVSSPFPDLERVSPKSPQREVRFAYLIATLVIGIAIVAPAAIVADTDILLALVRNVTWAVGLAVASGTLLGETVGWLPLAVLAMVSYLYGQRLDSSPRPWNIALLPVSVPTYIAAALALLIGVLVSSAPILERRFTI